MKRLLILLISLTLASPSLANDKALHALAGGLVSYVAEEDGLLASDYEDGIDRPERTYRMSFTVAEW